MTKVIHKDMEWLQEQIASGIEGYLESERENIIDRLTQQVLKQIQFESYADYHRTLGEELGKVVVEFYIPNPEECHNRLEYMERVDFR